MYSNNNFKFKITLLILCKQFKLILNKKLKYNHIFRKCLIKIKSKTKNNKKFNKLTTVIK